MNSYKVELVHINQHLMVREGISVRVRSIFWGEIKFSAIFAFLAEWEKAKVLSQTPFYEEIYKHVAQHYSMVRVANFEIYISGSFV